MTNQADLDKIQTWRQAGLLEAPAILERLSRAIAAHLAADAANNPVTSVPALAAAVPLLFRALRRLSAHPFTTTTTTTTQPDATTAGVTLDGLLRALFWAVPAHHLAHMTSRRRALFQALAAPDAAAAAAAKLPFDEGRSRAGAAGPPRGAGSGVNYEMFDRVLATVAPALLNPFHLLLEAFTKAPPKTPAQSMTGTPAAQTALGRQSGDGILSYSRLAQLRTSLQGRAGESTEDLQLKWEWDSGSAASAGEGVAGDLVKSMRGTEDETLLLVRGSRADGSSGELFTFGFYSARGAEDEASIEDICPTDDEVCVAAVFEVAPVQDAFPGILGRPGWGIREANGNSLLQFGGPEAGASLKIDLSTARATFTHKVPAAGEELNASASFRPSARRGSWEVELKVGRLELWSQNN
ncbi:hypothetical protein GGTG_07617 [Gaeumannomyces tritici R3-111a-1]|uniref:TLDc domain-containing protein n=1 Tax=Gaeumannomyces tritici (strain R3-111a-1) TaxID=644352 RepID=J3P269_GAET3|nr:hypothetical protein GGTG_07617 [Gaeumannomyces tritici R3-111a-1]EJT73761.1 hypothetical protein GGTG_07617 [Gaeumannomyces tritici R3-111a-1]